MKAAPKKVRMKDAESQVEKELDDDDSAEFDYKSKLVTKPLQPPPDIFMKLRYVDDDVEF